MTLPQVIEKLTEEYAAGFAFKEAHVDPASGVIHNVSLLGRHSKNNRTYSEQALQDAAKLQKGARIFLDHPTEREESDTSGVRRVRDLAGKVLRASVSGDRVKGDIQVLRGEGFSGDLLMAIAEQMPDAVGFSHRASGKARRDDDGHEVIESLDKVFGSDVVTEPATVRGLFESYREPKKPSQEPDEMDLTKLTLAELSESRPDLLKSHDTAGEQAIKLAAAEKENTELRAFKEAAEKHVAGQKRDALVAEKLKAADLPESLVTDAFRATLQEASDEAAVDALIDDRKVIWAEAQKKVGTSTGPTSYERDVPEDRSGLKPVTDEAMATAYSAMF